MIYNTWCERSPGHGVDYTRFCSPRSPGLMGGYRYERVWASISHLNIYKGSILLLWVHHTQYLVIYEIDLVLLLLLLTFCNTLLSYYLVLIRTITATDIPIRRNTLSTRTQYDLVRQQHVRHRKPRDQRGGRRRYSHYPNF